MPDEEGRAPAGGLSPPVVDRPRTNSGKCFPMERTGRAVIAIWEAILGVGG